MTANKEIFQHFHPDEFSFIEKMSDFIIRVENTYLIQVTEFLNPRQIEILKILVSASGNKCYASTDLYGTEYGRVIIAPDYYELNEDDFDIALIEIKYNAKFNQISHGQILGTLINELGIKRSLLGDILIEDGYAQIFINRKHLSYFLGNITKIARTSVSLKEVSLDQMIKPVKDEETIDITVSSLRVDRLLASVLKLSRSQSMKLIQSEKVKVNYRTGIRSSDILSVGDLISVRGFGRFKLLKDNGYSKNGKHKLSLSTTIHK
ncbi:YlmH family RNA-binding protein [Streptococcus catagoni]|uniref:YlmH family RNA-binding protein n=1 Tax=Streptococcus catagoni TaxID=2654874 RepID=UPI001408E367|nr:YlmH/Sll1252 family protein [Streptococcus catagoni]